MKTIIEGVEVTELPMLRDTRGYLVKVLMAREIQGNTEFGEIYVSASTGEHVRANHFHERTTEWFTPIAGEGELALLSHDGLTRMTVALRADAPVRVRVPPRVAHAFRASGGSTLVLLAYADVQYDPKDTDTFPIAVL